MIDLFEKSNVYLDQFMKYCQDYHEDIFDNNSDDIFDDIFDDDDKFNKKHLPILLQKFKEKIKETQNQNVELITWIELALEKINKLK
jgi:hypothetical protein